MREFPTVYVVVEHSHYWDDEVLVTTSNAVAGFYNLNEAEEFVENQVTDKTFYDYDINRIQVK